MVIQYYSEHVGYGNFIFEMKSICRSVHCKGPRDGAFLTEVRMLAGGQIAERTEVKQVSQVTALSMASILYSGRCETLRSEMLAMYCYRCILKYIVHCYTCILK